MLTVHKKIHTNRVYEKYLNSPQIYELYRIHYNWLDWRKILPTPCDYLLTLMLEWLGEATGLADWILGGE